VTDLPAARDELAAAARELAQDGLVTGTSGNLSARVGDHFLITPTGADLGQLRGEDIPLVDGQAELVDGELEPSSEVALHLQAYHRHGAGAVIHTHAPMATAVATVLETLPYVHYLMADLGGEVRVAPYVTFGSQGLAEAVADALEGRSAALMSNHGTLAIGDRVADAVRRTRLLEWVATLYWHASQLGAPRLLDTEQQHVAAQELADYGDLKPATSSSRRPNTRSVNPVSSQPRKQ
jgi:L-fuculose-phosphate aldolase